MRTLQALAQMLAYPGEELQSAGEELRDVIDQENLLEGATRHRLEQLLGWLETAELLEAQERYTELFDRTRSLSLYLFEHVYGEAKQRGQALVGLQEVYERYGLIPESRELPDYFPLYLEFCSQLPESEARARLSEPAAVFRLLRQRLEERESRYAAVFEASERLAAARPGQRDLERLQASPDEDPSDPEGVDRAWKEDPVAFGPGDAPFDPKHQEADA
jgi:nitrate reductase delta subunit